MESSDQNVVQSTKESEMKSEEVNIPKSFICPISQEMMVDPVVASDGFSYERRLIT